MDCLHEQQLVVSGVDSINEVEAGIPPVDYLEVSILYERVKK